MSINFIAVEGPDYVGKTTLAKKISKDTDFLYVKTPPKRYTPLRPMFDDLLETNPMSRFLFYCSGLVESSDKIREFLSKKTQVIADRYLQSLQFYHEALLDQNLDGFISQIDFVQPDIVFLLQADFKILSERAAKRGVRESDYEIEQNERVMSAVNKKYESIVGQSKICAVNTDGKDIDEVVKECLKQI
jgi:thymidylate kinase